MSTWKRDIASGLVVLIPLVVLAFVVSWLYQKLVALPFMDSIDLPDYVPAEYVPVVRVLIVLVVFAMLTLAVGYLMRTTIGRLGEGAIDGVINRVPVVRVVYNASKLAVETALTGTEDLQKPVQLEVWSGIRMTAFKTGKTTADGRVVLFMPTAPNITTGFVMEVEPHRIEETNEKVEEALTRILSAGFAETNEGVDIDVTDESGIEDLGRMN
ncbi:Uncharacterized membrane protein [Halogranum amylolyticum]|uniref:Uncharacterized membrane protein n=1 Tax=Halogranum amylolyticum TaxID=660520 RepID=A0A1H8QI89_9EURY|nr:DUF502 domain-containing protein [Halogranum amylolyticum]SEO53922.1 Uncharacterized membrane protein [Halogranum amylolyticum]